MGYDTWIDEMLKEVEKDKPKDEQQSINIKEEDLDKIADRVITKLSEVSASKSDDDVENNDIDTENKDEE